MVPPRDRIQKRFLGQSTLTFQFLRIVAALEVLKVSFRVFLALQLSPHFRLELSQGFFSHFSRQVCAELVGDVSSSTLAAYAQALWQLIRVLPCPLGSTTMGACGRGSTRVLGRIGLTRLRMTPSGTRFGSTYRARGHRQPRAVRKNWARPWLVLHSRRS